MSEEKIFEWRPKRMETIEVHYLCMFCLKGHAVAVNETNAYRRYTDMEGSGSRPLQTCPLCARFGPHMICDVVRTET